MRKVLPLVIVFIFAVSILAIMFVPANAHAGGNPKASDKACWGQASAVFAKMKSSGDPERSAMGEHASNFPNPRFGLRNLARALASTDPPTIPDDSMQALGAFVASELGLSIDACLNGG